MRRALALVAALLLIPATAHASTAYTYEASGVKRAAAVVVWCEDPGPIQDFLWTSGPLPVTGSFVPFVGGTDYADDGEPADTVICRAWAVSKHNVSLRVVAEITVEGDS